MPIVPTPIRSLAPGFPSPPRTSRGMSIGTAMPAPSPRIALRREILCFDDASFVMWCLLFGYFSCSSPQAAGVISSS